MAEQEPRDEKKEDADPERAARREFLKTIARGASVAPAVALLLAAKAKAGTTGGGGCGCGGGS